MQSQKITINDLKIKEKGWKELILLNEITLLQRFSQSGLSNAYLEAEHNAWIVKTLEYYRSGHEITVTEVKDVNLQTVTTVKGPKVKFKE